MENGLSLSPEDYRVALAEQVVLQEKLEHLMAERGLDALITLASNGEAPRGEETIPWMDTCLIWTMCGVPAMTVPVFRGPNSMPFGAQLVGRKYCDHVLLGLAEHLREVDVLQPAEIACLRPDFESCL